MKGQVFAILIAGNQRHEVEVEALKRSGRRRLPWRECGGPHRHAAGSRAGQRPAGDVESLAAAMADADHAARPGGVELARDVVHVEVLERDMVAGDLLPRLERLVDDIDTLAAVDRFHGCRLLERWLLEPRLLRLGVGKVDAMFQADVHQAGFQHLRLAADFYRVPEMGNEAVEDHRLLPIDAERAWVAEWAVL